jgi:hypothetical protein
LVSYYESNALREIVKQHILVYVESNSGDLFWILAAGPGGAYTLPGPGVIRGNRYTIPPGPIEAES